ncbi:uncharacterized protein MELLADRAFT_78396 [Melampsora larici-populina 98AG31]|uniref:DNA replication factor Cdt1 C-terminal domain-containing protein n=1 Tax=Melampsora larici-populina (strain 98AG31 / pathotype 3-4-7) TaxID=747676 RepID=F4RTV4_MELLP|nr:uncharacterized protein MELLADRAFT_78396 [Melampsora larici-populina 98AG31]EGG04067.1 hypothetical protein MELLADRAFT_78396 [Melampsora larici-populina 98AG31]
MAKTTTTTATNQQTSPTASSSKGVGHGGQKQHRTNLTLSSASFTTPPSHLNRLPSNKIKLPTQSSTNPNNIFPTSSSSPVRPTHNHQHNSPHRRRSSLTPPSESHSLHNHSINPVNLITPQNEELQPLAPSSPKARSLLSRQITDHINYQSHSPIKPNFNHQSHIESTPHHQLSSPFQAVISPRSKLPQSDQLAFHVTQTMNSPTKTKHPNTEMKTELSPARRMVQEDEFSDSSSDLEVQPPNPFQTTPRQSTSAKFEQLLYARDSPGSTRGSPKSKTPIVSKTKVSDTVEDVDPDQLPSTYINLLTLHTALERALLLHLATEGSHATLTTVHKPSTKLTSDNRMRTPEPEAEKEIQTFRLLNLISWSTLRPMVERGSGKSFTEKELSQLLWIWQKEETTKKEATAEEEEEEIQVGMGFIISRLESNRSFGLGIELQVKENLQLPTLSLVSPNRSKSKSKSSNPKSPKKTLNLSTQIQTSPNHKLKNNMKLISLWTSQVEERKKEVSKRLKKLWRSKKSNSKPIDQDQQQWLIPPIPCASLPSFIDPIIKSKKRVCIKAKEAAAKNKAASSKNLDGGIGSKTPTNRTDELRKKKLIESIFMVFSSSDPSKSLIMSLEELSKVITKSSRISLSEGEAIESIKLLQSICPDLIEFKQIGNQEWIQVLKEFKNQLDRSKKLVKDELIKMN